MRKPALWPFWTVTVTFASKDDNFTISQNGCWLVVIHSRIYVASAVTISAIFTTWKQEITNLWKFKWRGQESNPGPLALQAKSLTTRPPLFHILVSQNGVELLSCCIIIAWGIILLCNDNCNHWLQNYEELTTLSTREVFLWARSYFACKLN